ncbi:hypothetical protein DENSPDRAFT_926059 [Dentipellis sp. KUC8613]|nr:hypothetical protein DENSPDRAFT_926059 [Dentipellis sp. KUC8613]
MFTLQDPTGPYAVGTTFFTLPVHPAQKIGTSKIQLDGPEPGPALVLEEVAFRAYYPIAPSSTKSRKGLYWLLRPLADAVRGYSHFTGFPSWLLWIMVLIFGSRVKIPAYPNTPPLRRGHDSPPDNSRPNSSSTPPRWPLVLFSHGLGGGSTTYSQICANLASSGKVVLALEHRDGTSPVCMVDSATGKARPRLYINPEHVIWEQQEIPVARLALRGEQLHFRRREIYYAYAAFQELVRDGERGALHTMDNVNIDWEAWTGGDWVRCESDVSVVGHSFGGATVFSILSNPPPEDLALTIPISHAVALDPWLEPIAYPGPAPVSPEDTETHHPKLLVVNAEGFTLWKDHYERLLEVVPAWSGSYILTMVGAQHVSFSDFPVMLPPLIRNRSARLVLRTINELVLAFVDDDFKGALEHLPTRKMEIKIGEPWWWSKKVKRTLVGSPGDVIVH